MSNTTTTDTGGGLDRNYTATFTLIQNGKEGVITPKLRFDPMLDPTSEEAPAIYEYISGLALAFLRQVGAIDDRLQIIDEEKWEQVQLDVMREGTLN